MSPRSRRLLLAGTLLCAGVLVAVLSAARRENSASSPAPFTRLNEVITNDLSSFPELAPMEHSVDSFLQFWALHGAVLGIMRNDSLLYVKGFGKADESAPMTPGTCMRMASVSKLVTAVGIMKLQEEGKLYLDSPVFGPCGVLPGYDSLIRDNRFYEITVEHLLRHQAGFTVVGGDPMFSPHTSADEVIRRQLSRRLAFDPGTWQQYSNVGFVLLSRVIEAVSGEPYGEYMQKAVLEPAGCFQFRLGGTYLSDRLPGEARYYMQPDSETVPSFDSRYLSVEKCYGGNDISGLSGAGAWTASVPELMRLVASIDGYGPVEDILTEFSVNQMTTFFDKDTFGLGWNDCTPEGEWTRTGSFSGTSALVKVYPDGESWVFISNSSAWRGSRFTKNISALFKQLRRNYSSLLPSRDLFTYNPEA